MATGTCTWCGARRALDIMTPAEGDLLCPRCRDDYLEERRGDRLAALYGERFRHARGAALPVTPRDWRHRR